MDTTAAPTSETAAPTPVTRSDVLKQLEEIDDDIEFYKEQINAEYQIEHMVTRDFGPSYAIFRDAGFEWEEVAGCSEEHIAKKLLAVERHAHRKFCIV
jgi:hypothetical protein